MRIALGDVVTRDFLRSELRSMLEELDGDESGPRKKDKKKKDKPARADELAPIGVDERAAPRNAE